MLNITPGGEYLQKKSQNASKHHDRQENVAHHQLITGTVWENKVNKVNKGYAAVKLPVCRPVSKQKRAVKLTAGPIQVCVRVNRRQWSVNASSDHPAITSGGGEKS